MPAKQKPQKPGSPAPPKPVSIEPKSTKSKARRRQRNRKRKNPIISDPLPQPLLPSCAPQINENLWNELYEHVILLSAYGKSQGKHVDCDKEVFLQTERSLKKEFLDQLAFICDYLPHGKGVTAIAIEEKHGLVNKATHSDQARYTYWVAGNTGPGPKVIGFLLGILNLLRKASISSGDTAQLQYQISRRAIRLAWGKVQLLRTILRKKIRLCLRPLEAEGTKDSLDLRDWLISLRKSRLDLSRTDQLFVDHKDIEMLDSINKRAEEGSEDENDTSTASRFTQVKQLIDRLKAYIKAAWILIETGKAHPELFEDFAVMPAIYNADVNVPGYRITSSINTILERMTSPTNKKFSSALKDYIRKKYDPNHKFRLWHHAEIKILDLFHHQKFQFLDQVRYIGVSIPSCFLCYRYIQAHPLKAQTMGTTNNLFIQWQPPYVRDGNFLEDEEWIIRELIEDIKRFLEMKMKPKSFPIKLKAGRTLETESGGVSLDMVVPVLRAL